MISTREQERYERIAKTLTRPIPSPRVIPPKEQKSWRTLKVGDQLRLRPGVEGKGYQPNVNYEVLRTTNKGCTISDPMKKGPSLQALWDDPDWKATWEKVPARERTQH